MDKIIWWINQKNGIELVDENANLSEEYLKKAENALNAVKSLEGNTEWQISSADYSMYFSVYAILMKIGIKCEIHSCTLELVKVVLNKYFSEEDINLLKSSLSARIDAQYYTDRNIEGDRIKKMVSLAPKFHLKCKEIATSMTSAEIKKIRETIKNKMKKWINWDNPKTNRFYKKSIGFKGNW